MLRHKQVLKSFWDEALNVAVYVCSRVTSKALSKDVASLELCHDHKPDLSSLRVFGNRCWYKVVDRNLKKLEDSAVGAIFIGYTSGSHGYNLLDSQKKRAIVSRDVRFDEYSMLDRTPKHV